MRGKNAARVASAGAFALAAGAALIYWGGVGPDDLRERFESFGAWAPAAYVVAYIVAGLLFVPATPLTLAGGVLFGTVEGTLYALAAAVLSSAVAFLAARHIGNDWVRARAGPHLTRLVEGADAEGWRFVAFVRLVPIFHFSLLNYALGLTGIGFRVYLLTTAICMVPGTLAYAYVGGAGAQAIGGEGGVRGLLIGIGVLAALALLPRLIQRWRRHGEDTGAASRPR